MPREDDVQARYKEMLREKRDQKLQEEAQEASIRRDLSAKVREETWDETASTTTEGGKRVKLWDLVEQKTDSLIASSAEAYHDFRAGMTAIWQLCIIYARAMNYTYNKIGIAAAEGLTYAGFKAWDTYKEFKISRSDPELPELRYQVSLEDGDKIEAALENGETLSDDNLRALFVANVKEWVKKNGYQKINDEYVNLNKNEDEEGYKLTPEGFDALMADPVDGLEVWLKDRYPNLTINPSASPSP